MSEEGEVREERTGVCTTEFCGQKQIETSAMVISIREFPRTSVKSEQINRYKEKGFHFYLFVAVIDNFTGSFIL